ncbi:hypothetical protein M3Y99_01547500 [Aphelenchoides fujianensis]|nr:hypothetical protein M3Y99_01547500 [Aphelenchoides fujianensis]
MSNSFFYKPSAMQVPQLDLTVNNAENLASLQPPNNRKFYTWLELCVYDVPNSPFSPVPMNVQQFGPATAPYFPLPSEATPVAKHQPLSVQNPKTHFVFEI